MLEKTLPGFTLCEGFQSNGWSPVGNGNVYRKAIVESRRVLSSRSRHVLPLEPVPGEIGFSADFRTNADDLGATAGGTPSFYGQNVMCRSPSTGTIEREDKLPQFILLRSVVRTSGEMPLQFPQWFDYFPGGRPRDFLNQSIPILQTSCQISPPNFVFPRLALYAFQFRAQGNEFRSVRFILILRFAQLCF